MEINDFDEALFAVGTGLRADHLAYSAETWLSLGPNNPDTGQDWGPGDLQAYYELHGPSDAVREAMMVSAVNSAGDILVVTQAFEVKTSALGAPTFDLLQRTDITSDEEPIESYLTTVMFDSMNANTDMAQLVNKMAEESGMSLFEANVLADWYALQKLLKAGCTSALTTHDVEYAKALESLTNKKMFTTAQDAFNDAYGENG
jgi:hypothetical protein